MKSQDWPLTHRREEKSIPTPSRNKNDIVVELRLRRKEAQKIFEEAIAAHPHFCLEPPKFSQSSKIELIILEADYDHYPTLSFIESITRENDRPDIFLTSEVPDMSLAAQARHIGVDEFFPRPLQTEEISKALDRCAARRGRVPK